MEYHFLWIGEKIGVEYLYSLTGKQWNTKLLNFDPGEPADHNEGTPEDLDDEGFEEILTDDDDPTASIPIHETAIPCREQGEQESNNEPIPVPGKYRVQL